MKTLIKIFLLAMVSVNAMAQTITPPIQAGRNVSFFVGAFPNTIPLFMAAPLATTMSAQSKDKKVFIILSAGDAGIGGEPNSAYPYWKARQNGLENALIFFAGFQARGGGSGLYTAANVTIGGMTLERKDFGGWGDVILYTLKLPDIVGTATQTLGLGALQSGLVASMQPVTGTAVYSAANVRDVLAGIVKLEAPAASKIVVHTTESDATLNPGDHPYMTATTKFFDAATAGTNFACLNKFYYGTISNYGKPVNLPNLDLVAHADVLTHAGGIGAFSNGVTAGHRGNEWGNLGYVGKSYKTRSIASFGACAF
ncbi:hypothetical protein [Undibacterium sp. SXout20W]|uniref:hypothetical protein n=1 Tax=Undibacterium sp. SXout20W TaxID=3413051 RepID=UPI003BF1B943